jgi:hypothetical protein
MLDASGCWTLNTTDWHSGGRVCSLSSVLEPEVSERFSLSSKAATGILRRAAKRGRELPEALEQALTSVMETTSDLQEPCDKEMGE